jgi:hypothetical protein
LKVLEDDKAVKEATGLALKMLEIREEMERIAREGE